MDRSSLSFDPTLSYLLVHERIEQVLDIAKVMMRFVQSVLEHFAHAHVGPSEPGSGTPVVGLGTAHRTAKIARRSKERREHNS